MEIAPLAIADPITEMGVEHAFEHIHEFTILSCFT